MPRALLALLLAATLYANTPLGAPLQLKETTPIAQLNAEPAEYVGKTVQVSGEITEVCQMMGCWTAIRGEDGAMVRVKVHDGEIVFPKDSPGQRVTAEGEFQKFDLTREQALARAAHEAEEQGRPFDPNKVQAPYVYYQIQGTGALLHD